MIKGVRNERIFVRLSKNLEALIGEFKNRIDLFKIDLPGERILIGKADGFWFGICVVGIPATFPVESEMLNDEVWAEVEKGKEVPLGIEEIQLIQENIRDALEQNQSLPDGTICNIEGLSFEVFSKDAQLSFVKQYPLPEVVKLKIKESITSWLDKVGSQNQRRQICGIPHSLWSQRYPEGK